MAAPHARSATTAVVDANLAAYGRNDLGALAATLADDVVMAAYRGAVVAEGRAAATGAYERTIAAYPLHATRALNRIVFADTVVDHEVSVRQDSVRRYVATIYRVCADVITRIETVSSRRGPTGLEATQGQLDAYNAQDLDGYMAYFAPDCAIADYLGPVTQDGAAAIRARYGDAFATFPMNHARLVNRIAVAGVVFDHEEVKRSPQGPVFEALAIYSVAEGLIRRVEFVK